MALILDVNIYLVVSVVLTLLLITVKRKINKFQLRDEEAANLKKIPRISSIPFFGSLDYFGKPYDFLVDHAQQYPEIFSFNLLGRDVYYLGTSEEALKTFFSDSKLSFYEGYKDLFGAILGKDQFLSHNSDVSLLLQNLGRFSQKLIDGCPEYLEKQWGQHTKLDFFNSAYNIIFKMSTQFFGSAEISEDNFEVMAKCYKILDSEFSALSLFMPWFPNSTQRRRVQARNDINDILEKILQDRIDNPDLTDKDNLTFFVNSRLRKNLPVNKTELKYTFVCLFFAAQTNTALAGAWSLIYLLYHPTYLKRVMEEVNSVKKNNAKLTIDDFNKMKFLEKCIMETLRLTIASGGWWRKVTEDTKYNNYLIPKDSIIVNNPAIFHLNKFNDALVFDPDRTDAKSAIPFGRGTHPCLGQKLAILEVKIFLVTALTLYDIRRPSSDLPKVNRNTMHGSWPTEKVILEVIKK